MKFALIHYDVNRIVNEPGNRIVMKHFGHMPNIQLLYVAAILEALDVEIEYFDLVGMGITDNDLRKRLLEFSPDIIGMSVYTSHFHTASSYAAFCKHILPKTKILLGGVHTEIFPTETLEYNSNVDFACVGEAEMVLPEFVRRIKLNKSFEGMNGLAFRRQGRILYSGPAEKNKNLDSVPFPARHLVPNEKYFNFISTKQNYTVFNSSRGCPFKCIFCEASETKWRARSAENITEEFEECFEKFNIREIDIFDSSFTINKKRVLKLCQLLIDRGLSKKIIWNVRSRVDSIDKQMIEALKEAGCYRIFYGIESGNVEVLRKLKKKTNIAEIRKIVNLTSKARISTFGYFLIGSPGDTDKRIRETIDFAKTLPLDFAIFNSLTPFPKTSLYENYYLPLAEHDFWSEYIRESKPLETFVGRPWLKHNNEEIDRITHKAMLEFYFRPIQIYRAVKSIRSFKMIRRYFFAAIDMALFWVLNRIKRSLKK